MACNNTAEAKWSKKKIKHADKNKDRRIDAKEYKHEKQFEHKVKSKVDKKWEANADKNKDGHVDSKEYYKARLKYYEKKRSKVDRKWEKEADKNKDGKVSVGELRTYHKLKMDKNGDGKVDKTERHKYWIHRKAKVNSKYEKRYDFDGNGYITGNEAKEMLRDKLRVINTYGKTIVNTSLEREYDADGDGIIDRQEAETIKQVIGDN